MWGFELLGNKQGRWRSWLCSYLKDINMKGETSVKKVPLIPVMWVLVLDTAEIETDYSHEAVKCDNGCKIGIIGQYYWLIDGSMLVISCLLSKRRKRADIGQFKLQDEWRASVSVVHEPPPELFLNPRIVADTFRPRCWPLLPGRTPALSSRLS
jgi:hypothetical protein